MMSQTQDDVERDVRHSLTKCDSEFKPTFKILVPMLGKHLGNAKEVMSVMLTPKEKRLKIKPTTTINKAQ